MSISDSTSEVKWDKPKILLVDLPESVLEAGINEGYNVSIGSFGTPYHVQASGEVEVLHFGRAIKNHREQEIIFVDTMPPDTVDRPESRSVVPPGAKGWWVRHTSQVVDPRPRMMEVVRESFDRILDHGGVLVVFAGPRFSNELFLAENNGFRPVIDRRLSVDNWSFCSMLNDERLVIARDGGEEITAPPSDSPYTKLMERHLANMSFLATLKNTIYLTPKISGYSYQSLVENKFGASVGGVVRGEESKGIILICPRIGEAHLDDFVMDLLKNVLPDVSPHLFPHHEGSVWTRDPSYEHLSVLELEKSKQLILTEAQEKVRLLNEQIEMVRTDKDYVHGILTKTSDPLVADVKLALEAIGFSKVIDVDELEEDGPKQEDLQIHEKSPLLLVEVKGLAGFPTEGDTAQVLKYVVRRMKELERHDVSAVFVVNQQRNLPPLERDDSRVFTEQQIKDAEHNDMLLVTTWEIFQLLRGKEVWDWPSESLTELFYGKGRIGLVPTCYKRIGVVGHFYDGAGVISIRLDDDAELRKRETIGYKLQSGYFQEVVNSMQVDKATVEIATAGQSVGVKTGLQRRQLPVGSEVFAVRF